MRWCVLMLVCALCAWPQPAPASHIDVVRTWASVLGNELWQLGEALTKSEQIKNKYKQMNASVKKKDGTLILDSALRSVSTMLTRKINAVRCIHAKAEQLAMNSKEINPEDDFQYCSAKYSNFTGEDGNELPNLKAKRTPTLPPFAKNNSHYMNISVERDSHFYNINVNTSISCVHVPTNIYYMEKDIIQAINWTQALSETFASNYKSDPSLSWQYFGSSHGILRFYPAMPWNVEKVDTYDCRVRSWYIEAATCSKDVIILFDVSGSMTGFKNYVARRTLRTILDTLSNNDFVNVYSFNKNTSRVVHCFNGLVQATPENLDTINDALEPTDGGKKHKVPLEGYANLTAAYIKAFKTLKERRQNCTVWATQGCNQLVMLITDYVPGNLSEVFEMYNRERAYNKTYTPVRVFTYLIGKEVTNVAEIQHMACTNRGYFVHIHSVEEVQQQVLKYINVIARPMILDGSQPPPTWTHANIDKTRTKEWNVSGESDLNKPDEDKLVTSVAIPAFATKDNDDAVLLGVAGTDVPIDSIAKLAQPNQLGVNGYSFIVSNNGYLLLHPLLIATINDELQLNYNSVDFVEVEQVDDGKGSRELGDKIKLLRENLVYGRNGNMTNVEVLYHYDSMRRIARVKHDYFFNKLNQTPFAMGISLPRGYGDTELELKDNPLEAKEGQNLVGINVTQYFKTSFRVHPDWVYCKYHYLEGHESNTPEQEVYKFLAELSRNKIDITITQYPEKAETTESESSFDFNYHCGNATKKLENDDYYCNEDLVKQLVFDAKLTYLDFEKWIATDGAKALAKKYNVSVRFIATSSGLTRWHYLQDTDKNEIYDDFGNRNYNNDSFGETYHNAIEETWYKAAVLQYMIQRDSLVVSTPLPILDTTIKKNESVIINDDIILTSSYAIFYKDGDSETPASVVGFQFMYSSFFEVFLNITKNHRGSDDQMLSCTGGDYSCYIIDSSGYIVLSAKNKEDVGKFFGTIHPNVLQSFIDRNIYEHVKVFNYQALCSVSLMAKTDPNCSWRFNNPFSLAMNLLRWLLTEAILLWANILNTNSYVNAGSQYDVDDYPDLITDPPATTTATPPKNSTSGKDVNKEDKLFSCDHEISLYILNQSYFNETRNPVVYQDEDEHCSPAYWAAYVTKTNLLLVVVKANEFVSSITPENCTRPPNTEPQPTAESVKSREPCHKLALGKLDRRRLEGCFTYHDKERNITACGLGCKVRAKAQLLVIGVLLVAKASRIF